MGDGGGSEGVEVGDPVQVGKGQEFLIEPGDAPVSEIRRSERSKGPRTILTRGRQGKARPKSPLLIMAEMRKGGLRGRELRHSGRKGLEGTDLTLVTGSKRSGGKRIQVMESIAEGVENKEDLAVESDGGEVLPGTGALGGGDKEMVVDVGAETKGNSELDFEVQSELIPVGNSADLAMDLISGQPLLNMAFVGDMGKSPEQNILMLESHGAEDKGSGSGANNQEQMSDLDDFPPLSVNNLRAARDKERNRGGGEREVPRGVEQQGNDKVKVGRMRRYRTGLDGGITRLPWLMGDPRRGTNQRVLSLGRLRRWE